MGVVSNGSAARASYARAHSDTELYEYIESMLYNRVVVVICAFGLLGNILNLVVLTQRGLQKHMDRMEKSAYTGLVAMAASDAIFCLVTLPHGWLDLTLFMYPSASFTLYYSIYSNGVINVFIMTSTWLTVILSFSRYVAVCYPLRAKEYIGMTFTYISLVSVFLFSLLFNLPRFFNEFPVTISCVGGFQVYYRGAGYMKENPTVRKVYMWSYFVIAILLPVVVLAYCNSRLIQALRESAKLRRRFRRPDQVTSTTDGTQRISLTLVIIIVMYLIFVAPAETLGFLRDMGVIHNVHTYNLVTAIFNVLQALNFSANFVLYCIINVHFRKTVSRMLLCQCTRGHRSDRSMTSSSFTSNSRLTSMRYESVTTEGVTQSMVLDHTDTKAINEIHLHELCKQR